MGLFGLSVKNENKFEKKNGHDSRLSMARMVMLCTAFVSRSKGLAVLMTPLAASMLKKRSRSVFRSIEYLNNNNKLNNTNRNSFVA